MANKHICGYIISSAFTEITKSLYILTSFCQVTIKINTTLQCSREFVKLPFIYLFHK